MPPKSKPAEGPANYQPPNNSLEADLASPDVEFGAILALGWQGGSARRPFGSSPSRPALKAHLLGDPPNVKTTLLPEKPDAKSPAGADIRYLMEGPTGGMIYSTVPPHQTNRATVHATVSEFWFVLEGHGEIWRDDGMDSGVTELIPGTSIDIPVGTAFQYRNVADLELRFICVTMPPWPGDAEATYVDGIWEPTVPSRPAG